MGDEKANDKTAFEKAKRAKPDGYCKPCHDHAKRPAHVPAK
jgi:hypothetical protein